MRMPGWADARPAPSAMVPLPDGHEERGVYILSGTVDVAGERFDAGRILVFRPRDRLVITAGPARSRCGGCCSSSREWTEQAKADWKAGRFALVPGDDKEFIPLPERRRGLLQHRAKRKVGGLLLVS